MEPVFWIKESSLKFASNFRNYLPQFKEPLYQKFQTKISKIAGIPGTFWKRHLANLSGFYWSQRLIPKKPLNMSFCSLQLFYLRVSRRSKVKVTFCDPGTFELKFESCFTLNENKITMCDLLSLFVIAGQL